MPRHLEVLFSPAEFNTLPAHDLTKTTCVVFDVLRATTSMITAFAHGAHSIIPVVTISEALALRTAMPGVLLAGERDGLRIRRSLTASCDFDLGNSPREFTSGVVAGKTIVMTTTNGTRALRSCTNAQEVLAASFLNLPATARHIEESNTENVLAVCAGTFEEAAYEDALAAGALCDQLWQRFDSVSDSAQIARRLYLDARDDLLAALQRSRNAQRLLSNPDLADDVRFALQQNTVDLVAVLGRDGALRKLGTQ